MTKKFHSLFNRVAKYGLTAMFMSMILVLVPLTTDFSSVSQAHASTWWDKAQNGGLNQVSQAYGGETVPQDARRVVVDIIKIVLGFLGIIAVVLILYAGFLWMTAGGNDDKISEAKKILSAGIIGLVIILSAYAIANFVINQIYGATTGTQIMQ